MTKSLDKESTFFRNSLSLSMMSELHTEITENQNDLTLRVIIITAEGNIFSAGHNLKELVC